jgi:phosphatidylinositol N-acetylglucosaminyltransferase subunit Q
MRLGVILVHASMETVLAFMNHFPLFALMLRAKDSWRLPG